MSKNLLIIGGGITGCLAALYARTKNFNVSLHEKKNYLGGVLRDFSKNDLYFFNGCQYLNTNNDWLKNIKDLYKELSFFKVNYGSYTNFEKEIFTKNFPGPVFESISINLRKKKSVISLKDRVEVYPLPISKNIKSWLNINNINYEELSHQSCEPISIKRIFLSNKKNELKIDKKKKKTYDKYYGLPRKYKNDLVSAIPTKGYNDFFDKLFKLIKKKNIKIILNSLIKINNSPKGIKIYSFNNEIKYDHVIWCCSPTLVFLNIENTKLDSKFLKITNYFFTIKKQIKNFYVQVFDKKNKIFRIGTYTLAHNNHICLEAFDDNLNTDNLKKELIKILKGFDIDLKDEIIKYVSKTDTKRYVFTSKNDLNNILNFRKKYNQNFIDGSWELYSRDDKLKNIFNQIDNIK